MFKISFKTMAIELPLSGAWGRLLRISKVLPRNPLLRNNPFLSQALLTRPVSRRDSNHSAQGCEERTTLALQFSCQPTLKGLNQGRTSSSFSGSAFRAQLTRSLTH